MNAELLLMHINRQFVLTNNSQAGHGRGGGMNAGSAEMEKENKEKHWELARLYRVVAPKRPDPVHPLVPQCADSLQ